MRCEYYLKGAPPRTMCGAEEITIEETAGQVEAERVEARKNTGDAKGGVANDGTSDLVVANRRSMI